MAKKANNINVTGCGSDEIEMSGALLIAPVDGLLIVESYERCEFWMFSKSEL